MVGTKNKVAWEFERDYDLAKLKELKNQRNKLKRDLEKLNHEIAGYTNKKTLRGNRLMSDKLILTDLEIKTIRGKFPKENN